MRIACVGDNCIDYYDATGAACPGGNPVNVAVYARRMGVETAYLGAVGTDRFGDLLIRRLEEERVDVSHVQRLKGSTALCHVSLQDGDRILGDYDEGVMQQFALRDEDLQYLKSFDLVVTGLWGHTEHYLEQIRANGTPTAFDGAERPFDPAGLIALPHTNIAFFSDDTADDAALKEKLLAVAALGPDIAVATRGAHGSLAFIAGFLRAWLECKSISACMLEGARNAAITIGYTGAW